MELAFENIVERAGQTMELTGVAIIASGALYATVLYALRWRERPPDAQYRRYRQTVGRTILLGLEFLLATDAGVRPLLESPDHVSFSTRGSTSTH